MWLKGIPHCCLDKGWKDTVVNRARKRAYILFTMLTIPVLFLELILLCFLAILLISFWPIIVNNFHYQLFVWSKIPECLIPVAEREWGRGGGRRGQEAPEGGGLKERGA